MPAPGYYDLKGRMLPGGNLAVSPGSRGQPRSISGIDVPTPGQYVPDPGTGIDYSNTIPAAFRTSPGLVDNPLPGKNQYYRYLNDEIPVQGLSQGASAQTPSYINSPTPDLSVYAPGGNTYPAGTSPQDDVMNMIRTRPGYPFPSATTSYDPSTGQNWAANASQYPDLSNAPMVTAGQYVYPQYAAGTSPYPMPGGFGTPSQGFFGDLWARLMGRPTGGPATSFDPSTGQNWATNASGYPDLSNASMVGVDAPALANQPLPAVQQLLFGNAAQSSGRTQPSPSNPTGTYGFGPNYVDPVGAAAFFSGLANWNAGGWTTAGNAAGEGGLGTFGRGPVTAQGLARAAALRGGGGGGGSGGGPMPTRNK